MSLPCLESYYKAAQLQYVIYWCDRGYDAKWKELELSQLDIPLQSLLGYKSLETKYSSNLSDLTKVPVNIWFKEICSSHLERKAWLLRWVEQDRDFGPAQLDLQFKEMSQKGITLYCVISSNSGSESFQQLQEKHDLGKQDFY